MHACMHVYTHTYICIYVYVYVYTYVNVHVDVYVYTSLYIYMYIYIYIIHTCWLTSMYFYLPMCTSICTCVYICEALCIYISLSTHLFLRSTIFIYTSVHLCMYNSLITASRAADGKAGGQRAHAHGETCGSSDKVMGGTLGKVPGSRVEETIEPLLGPFGAYLGPFGAFWGHWGLLEGSPLEATNINPTMLGEIDARGDGCSGRLRST